MTAIADALGYEMHDVGAQQFERTPEDDRGGDAVHVVVAVNGDAFAAGNRGADPIHGVRHSAQDERVVEVLVERDLAGACA